MAIQSHEAEAKNLKVIFIPFSATSHIIPLVEMARLFAMHGVDSTIVTTAGNAGIFQKSIDHDFNRGRPIKTHVLEFPAKQVNLSVVTETFNTDTPLTEAAKFQEGFVMLQSLIENYLLGELEVDCIVSDLCHPWTVEVASKLGIPRIVFSPASIFSRCAELLFEKHRAHNEVESDYDKFTIVGFPHKFEMSRSQLPDWMKKPSMYGMIIKALNDSARRSYGAIFNSFSDFEGAYEEHYKNAFGTKCWGIGPVSLWANQDVSDKEERGEAKVEEGNSDLLKWLHSKKENSVIYVSFGSLNKFPPSQLIEIAHALEASSHNFIWVVRKNINEKEGDEGFMEEFEKRMKENNKGYLIWGWAPQMLILENKAIGGIVTHCGWSTIMESIKVGLPMIIIDVLRIGVSVGAKEWRNWNEFGSEVVKREEIEKAIALVMENGKESEEMRSRSKALSEDAKKAILVGGSSHANLMQLIHELKSLKHQRLNGVLLGQ
ncbi:putative soyasapogenol B glucuronide galactosyltransferase [Medicago truncatula]|uniref:Putative soyasapogenol B glucuronide galactosyltransferase n=1 Tax=Medicago truncatula TaxID=3880 RepID=A0A396HXB0_MEDTR|nr:putative soyasapogenol B glucuronide galactosyltransferase [Medicago truncatula]